MPKIYHLRNVYGRYSAQRSLAMGMILLATVSFAMAQTSDTTPPQLVSFSFTPTTIDLSGGPQSVTVTLGITDDLSGVPFGASVNFRSPSFGQNRTVFPARTAGDPLNGTC